MGYVLEGIAECPCGSAVLDFGAGSLRDSFELTRRGYSVTSIDLNADLLASYEGDYDWPNNGTTRNMITGQDLQGCISANAWRAIFAHRLFRCPRAS